MELAATLPTTYLIRDGWHKWILRRAFVDLLPENVVWRKQKMGFPFSYERFFSESAPIVDTIIRESSNPFLSNRSIDIARNDWRSISVLLWYELFFNDNRKLFAKIKDLAPPAVEDPNGSFTPEFLAPALEMV